MEYSSLDRVAPSGGLSLDHREDREPDIESDKVFRDEDDLVIKSDAVSSVMLSGMAANNSANELRRRALRRS